MLADLSRRTFHLSMVALFLLVSAMAGFSGTADDLYQGRDYIRPAAGAPGKAAGPASLAAAEGAQTAALAAVPSAPDGALVTYTSFHDGAPYSMVRFNGRNTALLVQRKDLDIMGIARIRKLLDEQDILYDAMAELTAGEPTGTDLLPIAIVENTCGGGCGFIGGKGVEIIAPVFHQADYISFATHEMLHNFDRFSSHLYNGVDPAHAWNAFMDNFVPYYLHKGDNSLQADDVLKAKTVEKLGPFEAYDDGEWQNCVLNVQCDPAGSLDPTGMAVLTQGGVLLRIAQLHGRHPLRNWVSTLQGLIASRGLDAALMTPQQRSDLMIESVGLALGVDVSCYFDAWHWPVGAAVRSALAAFGTNGRCLDPDADGSSEFAKDCKTDDGSIFPGAVETANGVDNDCDGAVDDVLTAESGDFPSNAAGAQVIALNRRITGQIGPTPDSDFFRFNLPAAGWVRFTVKSTDFGGFFTFHGPEGLRYQYVDTGHTETVKYQLAAGDWTFDLSASQPGSYEVVVQSDYAFPLAADFQPITFTPAAAAQIGANLYRIPTPGTPASISALPGLTLNWWSSRMGSLASFPPASASWFDWSAPASTDPDKLAIRAFYRSNGVPVHPYTQHQSLLGPTPWATQDIGAVGVAGSSANFGEGDFTLRGSGADIWANADAFRFTWTRLSGNGEIKARVLQIQNTDPFAKAGVMFREDLTPGSKNVLAGMLAGSQFTFQRRVAAGGVSVSTKVAGFAAPHWVRITRTGDVFRAYRSADGSAWTEVGNVTLPMAANAYVGLAVTSHNNPVLATASLDNVFTPGAALPPPVYSISGRVTASGGAGISAVSMALTGSASANATTDANGNYSFANLAAGGSYTVTPAKSGQTFAPANRAFNNLQANAVGDFTGSPIGGGGLPSPWLTQDIGAVGPVGNASHNSGTFTVNGAGADIWGNADAFRIVYQTFSGDLDLRARVTGVQNTNVWAKAGVIVRENLGPGSKSAAMVVSAASGLSFQNRVAEGGITASVKTAGVAPKWVRITRTGSTVTGFWSDNGTSWTQVGSVSLSMSTSLYVGMAVTSHNTAALCQGVFTNVTVAAPPANPWTRTDIGAVGLAGSGSVNGSSGTVTGAGADIWGTADAFTFMHRPIIGDGSITVRVTGVQNTNAWAKAGVMIRESLAAGAVNAAMVVTPVNGLSFQRRTATNGTSVSNGVTGAAPRWVRLTRAGNVFTAYQSTDGNAWTQVGTVTLTMGANVYMGLAVTSHTTAALCQGTFDNIATVE